MAKFSTKQRAALAKRLEMFVAKMPSGQACIRPGSQNRKKGFRGQKKR